MGRKSIAACLAFALFFVASAVYFERAARPALAAAIPFGTGSAFLSIASGDANHGWAVGSNVSVTGGLIAATTDGGATWTTQSFPMVAVDQFTGVAAAGPTTAWAVGHNSGGTGGSGVVMATTDGSHWSPQTIPSVNRLTGVSFVGATTGWAVGAVSGPTSTAAILATINGGTTWTSQTAPAGVDGLTSVSFVDANHGWAAGSASSGLTTQSVVLATSDGGAHWTKQTVPAGMHLNAINFRDATHGWAAGLGTSIGGPAPGQVIATSDGGTTWTAQTLPAGIPGVSGLAFGSLSVGWIVGTNLGGPGTPGSFVAVTTNGGATWTRQLAPPTNAILYAVAAMSPTKVWAVGGGPCLDPSIIATANGGGVWTEELNAVPILTSLRAVTSVDTTHAWAVGTDSCQSGAIVRTVDGATWTAAAVPAGVGDLMAVSFADRNDGWAVGFNQGGGPAAAGIALATNDGGATWSMSPIPAGIGALFGVHFISATKGWAAGTGGNQGVIITTSDGGMSWMSQSLPAGVTSVSGVWFVDATHGWASATSSNTGQILITGDGGVTWAAQTIPANSLPSAVDFVDAMHGWAAGNDSSLFSGGGQVLTTSDGGTTWTAHAISSADYLQSVSFADASNGWVAGFARVSTPGGVIAASMTGGASWITQTVPSSSITELDGISAASTTNAWAVGVVRGQGPYGINTAVILGTSNAGTAWSAQPYDYPGMPRQAIVPALANAAYGGYTTATYIQNLGSSPAMVQVKYFDALGSLVGIGDSATIQPNATWIVRQDNGHSLAVGQAGSGLVFGSQPLATFVNEFAPGGGDATSYTGIASGAGGTLFAPAIANNAYGGYTTGIGLVNVGSSVTNLTVTYRDGTGTTVKTQTVNSVAAGAYQALYSGDATLGLPIGFAGTATIASSAGPVTAIVNETGPGGQFSSYDAVPAVSTTLYAPVALNNAYGGYNTGMAIQNATATVGTVTINYYETGGAATTKTFPIAANGYLGVYQGTDIPVAGAYTAKLTSTVAIAAIVNEVAPSATAAKQSTAYNTFAGGTSSLHLPLVESAGIDGWSTGEGIMNTGTAAITVTATYYDSATGAQVGTPQSLSVQPNAFWGLYQPTGGLPNGVRASAIVTTAAGGKVAVICNESNATTFMSYNGQ